MAGMEGAAQLIALLLGEVSWSLDLWGLPSRCLTRVGSGGCLTLVQALLGELQGGGC